MWFVGLLVAVNESIYEHMKLLIFPLLVWWLIITPLVTSVSIADMSLIAATCWSLSISSLCGNGFIALTFLFVRHVCHYEALWLDIFLFVVGVCIAQYVAWSKLSLYTDGIVETIFQDTYIILLATVLAGMYLTFTEFTPQYDIVFQDSSNASNLFYGRPTQC
jgi:hypothetical protein